MRDDEMAMEAVQRGASRLHRELLEAAGGDERRLRGIDWAGDAGWYCAVRPVDGGTPLLGALVRGSDADADAAWVQWVNAPPATPLGAPVRRSLVPAWVFVPLEEAPPGAAWAEVSRDTFAPVRPLNVRICRQFMLDRARLGRSMSAALHSSRGQAPRGRAVEVLPQSPLL